MSLDELRQEIDAIDERLAELICSRADIAHRIGATKREQNAAIHDPQRVGAVLQHVAGLTRAPLTSEEMKRIFLDIISVCTRVQQSGSAERG